MKNTTINYRIITGLIVWTVLAFIIGSTLAGCNMMSGLGQDITAAANGIQKEMANE
jgi:predicted small secreted protein